MQWEAQYISGILLVFRMNTTAIQLEIIKFYKDNKSVKLLLFGIKYTLVYFKFNWFYLVFFL